MPGFIEKELRAFLGRGIAANGFARVHCSGCGHDRLVPFSCKRRGFRSSCAGRRMAEGAANLVDLVLPLAPVRLTELPDGRLRDEFRHAWRDGTQAVLFDPLELIESLAAEHRIENLPELTKQALEQNAVDEAKQMAAASQALAGGALEPEEEAARRLAHDGASCGMAQFLTECMAREHDVAELAPQNGLLPAIHGSGLPKR